jgi:hypothetical protein
VFGLRWRWRLRVGRSWGIGGDGTTAARWMGDRVAVVTGRSERPQTVIPEPLDLTRSFSDPDDIRQHSIICRVRCGPQKGPRGPLGGGFAVLRGGLCRYNCRETIFLVQGSVFEFGSSCLAVRAQDEQCHSTDSGPFRAKYLTASSVESVKPCRRSSFCNVPNKCYWLSESLGMQPTTQEGGLQDSQPV